MSKHPALAPDWTEPRTPTTCYLDPDISYHDNEMPEKTSEKQFASSVGDVEAQSIYKKEMGSSDGPTTAAEYRTSMRVKLIYLSTYFMLNLSLTLYNKALLDNVS